MKPSHILLALSLPMLLALPAARAADTPKAEGAVAEACAADVKKLCPDIKPGEGRIAACLRDKRKQVSEGCRDAIKAQRREGRAK